MSTKKYTVYVRTYHGPYGRSRPVGRTNSLVVAVAKAAALNARRLPGQWYGIETSVGRPVYRPLDASCEPCCDLGGDDGLDDADLLSKEVTID